MSVASRLGDDCVVKSAEVVKNPKSRGLRSGRFRAAHINEHNLFMVKWRKETAFTYAQFQSEVKDSVLHR